MSRPTIALCLVIHNHQPVGNFGSVFEENHRLSYQPMLDALERHPHIRLGLHYTGPLLEWLKVERSEAIDLLRRLVDREQVEILGGGYYEPVLASLPDADRTGQLVRMADELETLFGHRPRGAWLAERVWEPDLPAPLADAGYEYTILDDAHLRSAAIPPERHWGVFSTDDQGRRLLVLGTEEGLRYLIPFRPVEDVIEHLRRHATEAGDRLGVMGDDGEKFGGWPTTWELCWGREAWVERFFQALERESAWLTTLRPSDAIDRFAPLGRVYVPTGSYMEMGEWSLPLEQRREFSRVMADAIREERPEVRWMRGGFWRTFQVTYSEIGALHKQMLRASAAVHAAFDGMAVGDGRRDRVLDHLYRGQSNDCYWHGLFGGIYLSHMRLATASHLIAAEDAAERIAERSDRVSPGSEDAARVEVRDIDLDGHDEVLIRAPGQFVALDPREGGGIAEWDVRAVRHALSSVMRRRPEAYHDTLVAHETGAAGPGGPSALSIDESVRVMEEGLSQRLAYDDHERHSGLVRFLAPDVTLDALEAATALELGDFVTEPFEVLGADPASVLLERVGALAARDGRRVPVRVRKASTFGVDRRRPSLSLTLEVRNEGDQPIEARLATEWSINLLGGGGNPQAWIEANGERQRFDTRGQAATATELSMGNDWIGLELRSRATPTADAWWYSIDTISLSEQGFERNHQGACLLWSWPLRLEPGASKEVRVEMDLATDVDRAEEEGL